jgi:GH24 family phage-related lysozyme (muramidase)
MSKRISEFGVSLIKSFEGCRLKAYICPANVPTIGYGHTGKDVTEDDVRKGKTITDAEATVLLLMDLTATELAVEDAVGYQRMRELKQHHFDALVSFVFNVGIGAFIKSTMLRLIHSGCIDSAANQFQLWTKGGGRVLPGLVKRREAERRMFIGEIFDTGADI